MAFGSSSRADFGSRLGGEGLRGGGGGLAGFSGRSGTEDFGSGAIDYDPYSGFFGHFKDMSASPLGQLGTIASLAGMATGVPIGGLIQGIKALGALNRAQGSILGPAGKRSFGSLFGGTTPQQNIDTMSLEPGAQTFGLGPEQGNIPGSPLGGSVFDRLGAILDRGPPSLPSFSDSFRAQFGGPGVHSPIGGGIPGGIPGLAVEPGIRAPGSGIGNTFGSLGGVGGFPAGFSPDGPDRVVGLGMNERGPDEGVGPVGRFSPISLRDIANAGRQARIDVRSGR